MIKALTTQVIREAIEDVGSLGEQPPTAPTVEDTVMPLEFEPTSLQFASLRREPEFRGAIFGRSELGDPNI